MDQLQNHNGPLLNSLLKKHFNPYWEIFEIVLLENSSNYFFEIKNLGRHVGRLLENSSIKNHDNLFSFYQFWGHTDHFTGKLIQTKCYISYMVSVKKIRTDEFSSKTVCVTPQN